MHIFETTTARKVSEVTYIHYSKPNLEAMWKLSKNFGELGDGARHYEIITTEIISVGTTMSSRPSHYMITSVY